jgi:hypothetical protein
VYPDAHHAFDAAWDGGPVRLGNVLIAGVGRGSATVGPNPAAREAARVNVRRELAEVFGR